MSDRTQTWIVEANPHAARVWQSSDGDQLTPIDELERDDDEARRRSVRGSWSQVFAGQLARWIEARAGQFQQLVLTGRPRFLDLVRARLAPATRAQVAVVTPPRTRAADPRQLARQLQTLRSAA